MMPPLFWYFWFALAFLITFIITPLVARVAEHFKIVDLPGAHIKKHHKYKVPLLGGVAIFLGISITVATLVITSNALTDGQIRVAHYTGFILGGIILMIGGYFDDKYDLKPRYSILFPIAAALVSVYVGTGVSKLSNPFGNEPFVLAEAQSNLLTFFWLMVVMYVTKFLDGLDGLATGVSAIGAFMIFLLSSTVAFYQPDVALFAFVTVGAFSAFLKWNFFPAQIFLGEGGSTYVGYVLGTLAIIGGGKFGTALLVISIPFLDLVWVIFRRVFVEKKSPTKGDRKHLHHRLLDMGLSQKQIVLIYYTVAVVVGMTTLFLQSKEKIIMLGILAIIMAILATYIITTEKDNL